MNQPYRLPLPLLRFSILNNVYMETFLYLCARACMWLVVSDCGPTDCSPPGSSVHGILQERGLEWVAIPFARGSSWPRDQTRVSCIAGRFFTIWATVPLYRLTDVAVWVLIQKAWDLWDLIGMQKWMKALSSHLISVEKTWGSLVWPEINSSF